MKRNSTISVYKCEHCKDTGWCIAKREKDGTEMMVMCYCHPLVRSGKAKPLDGDSALRRLRKKRKGVYEVGD